MAEDRNDESTGVTATDDVNASAKVQFDDDPASAFQHPPAATISAGDGARADVHLDSDLDLRDAMAGVRAEAWAGSGVEATATPAARMGTDDVQAAASLGVGASAATTVESAYEVTEVVGAVIDVDAADDYEHATDGAAPDRPDQDDGFDVLEADGDAGDVLDAYSDVDDVDYEPDS